MNKEKQIDVNEINRETLERYDIARVLAQNFHINGEGWDESDFEWTAHCLQMEGYRKQREGVEVCRCRDCIYWENGKDYTPYCNNIDGLTEPDAGDFCSYAERKER